MRQAVFAVIKKELRQTVRDKRMLIMLLMAPVVQLTLLGFAVNLDVDHVKTVVVDQDGTAESRRFVNGLVADPTLDVVAWKGDPERPLEVGESTVVIVIPNRFADDLKAERSVQIQVLIDGTNPIDAQAAVDACRRYTQEQSLALASERLVRRAGLLGATSSLPSVTIEPRNLYNPSMKSPIYMVPGVAAVVLLIVTTVVTAMGIARERELGTIEQLLVTPIHPLALLLGKILPFAGIGLVTTGMVLGVGTNLFHVPIRGSLLVVFFGTVLYLLNTLGTGVIISTLARTQQQAILGGFFFILPAILLSGFMSPIENMPFAAQALSALNPVRYYVEILRSTLLKGASFSDLIRPFLTLLAFGIAILGFGTVRFRKQAD